jgi:competence ComEA-like helix-hairpin-helix protein
MPTFESLKISAGARPLVDRALARAANAEDKKKIEETLLKAALTSGNLSLSVAEVTAVVDAFDRVAGNSAGTLASDTLGLGLDVATASLKSMESLSNADGVSVHFTEQEKLATRLVSELHDAVARANGRPMDVNMMIFEFQSDEVEKAIVDAARANPNLRFRIIGDSGQATPTGGNALPSILEQKLPNIEVKYKKDFPYTWDAATGRPKFNHGSTQGLNHHKGFATFIEGKPDRLVTGSFNWSNTANDKNYEDLAVFKAVDASTRNVISDYGAEFAGMWNNSGAALSPNAFANFKKEQSNAMLVANGRPAVPFRALPDDTPPAYAPKLAASFDANGFRVGDLKALSTLLGASVAKEALADRKKFGRFDSVDELKERVPSAKNVDPAKLAQLEFGSGKVSINNASLDELDQLGFTQKQAAAIVKERAEKGDFNAVEDLLKVPGVTSARLKSLEAHLSAVDVEPFFNGRVFGSSAGVTGYGPAGSRTTAAADATGVVRPQAANITLGANDLFHRAKAGDAVVVAMYGMSGTSPEFKALAEAAKRGAKVRVVLNDDYTAPTVAALKALAAQGLSVEVRVQKARTMHEKFGVVGDDVFFGSANFSESSSTKHSEDRFTVKNHRELAERFQGNFEALWAKSKPQ